MKKVLFVCYGGGHVRMVVPVAKALRDRGLAEVQVLGLTTAADVVQQSGLQLLQFKDFVRSVDAAALARGRQLAAGLDHVVDEEETAAYLGLSWADLEGQHGLQRARERFAAAGRQAFLPVHTMKRILSSVRPDLVVATSSPRAERAVIEAAGALSIPAVCLVDMFCVDEIAWIGRPGFAQRICVLNEATHARLLEAGRTAEEVVVTGNPAFDPLNAPAVVAEGAAFRQAQGWAGAQVVLWASQPEPLTHPSVPGRAGRPELPGLILAQLLAWQAAVPGRALVVRPHPSEAPPDATSTVSVRWDGGQFALHPLLHAVDAVVTMNSTVGLEGHLAGCHVVQVLGSLFDDSVPLARFGMATACADPAQLPSLLPVVLSSGTRRSGAARSATDAVVDVLKEF